MSLFLIQRHKEPTTGYLVPDISIHKICPKLQTSHKKSFALIIRAKHLVFTAAGLLSNQQTEPQTWLILLQRHKHPHPFIDFPPPRRPTWAARQREAQVAAINTRQGGANEGPRVLFVAHSGFMRDDLEPLNGSKEHAVAA